MIPYILAAIGGYLIGDSMKERKTFADGGITDDDESENYFDELRAIGDLSYSYSTYQLEIDGNIIEFKYDENEDEYTIKRLYGYNVYSLGKNLGMKEQFSNVAGKDIFTGSITISKSMFKDIVKKFFGGLESYKKSVSAFYSDRKSSGTID